MKDFKESRSGFSGYGWEKKGRLKMIVRRRKGG